MPRRRLDDHIRSLCRRVVATRTDEEVAPLLEELSSAIREKIQRVRISAVRFLLEAEERPERRKQD